MTDRTSDRASSPPGQRWDPARYQKNAGFVSTFGEAVLDWLAPQPGERILDLGCGDGALTEKLVAAGCTVVCVDNSAEQIAAARARGLDAHVADGAKLAFRHEFDAVFSNAALHWMTTPDAVIAGVAGALKPGGRFVGEFGGRGNVETIVAALTAALATRGVDAGRWHPWYFPDESEYATRLEAGGFVVDRIERFARPTPLPGPLGDWLDTFAESFLAAVPEAERPALKNQIADATAPKLRDSDGIWRVDYVRLRFAAHLAPDPAR